MNLVVQLKDILKIIITKFVMEKVDYLSVKLSPRIDCRLI